MSKPDTTAMCSLRPLAYRQFGAADGQLVVYFHGTPGAPDECQVLDSYAKVHGLTIVCFDRSRIDLRLEHAAYYRRIAALTLWVGISRINVGAHFPADVLAGYLCGTASGLLSNKAVTIRLR